MFISNLGYCGSSSAVLWVLDLVCRIAILHCEEVNVKSPSVVSGLWSGQAGGGGAIVVMGTRRNRSRSLSGAGSHVFDPLLATLPWPPCKTWKDE